jgi:DNA-binding transcriptional LysR family regulator
MTGQMWHVILCTPILRSRMRRLQKRTSLRWDELRLVLAIGRAGTLSGGARALAIDHSTAFRQLGALEARLGVRLFERARDGYVATPAGEAAIATARGVDDAVGALETRLAGADLRPSGTLRVTTTDTLVELLAPLLAAFRADHPEITLELAIDNAFFTLSRRDADVAIRPTTTPPDTLVGRRIAGVASALYATRRGGELVTRDWIGFDDSLAHLGAARWLAREIPAARIVCRANSLLALRALARRGVGAAALPCFLGDAAPGLVRLRAPIQEMDSALWLLTHADLRRVARVRVFLEARAAARARQRPLLEGRALTRARRRATSKA